MTWSIWPRRSSAPTSSTEHDEDNERRPLLSSPSRSVSRSRSRSRPRGVTPTPLPRLQLAILLLMRLSEPIAFTVVFPFIPQMLSTNLPSIPRSRIGYYAGLIESSFAIVQFICSPFWATLSDSIGRKPVLLIGLAGTFVSINAFGLSRSFAGMIVGRCVNGLANGNVAVIKSALGEMTDETNQARAFTLIPLAYAAGSVIGPTLGGYLSEPVSSFPGLFGDSKFLSDYPFWLPCFVASLFNLVGIALGWLFLEETLPANVRRAQAKSSSSPSEDSEANASPCGTGASTPTLTHRLSEPDLHSASLRRKAAAKLLRDVREREGHESHGALGANGTPTNGDGAQAPTSSTAAPSSSAAASLDVRHRISQILSNPRILRVMFAQSTVNLINISYVACLPLFASERPELGGIGFDKQDIGHLLATTGLLGIIVQLLVFPWLERTLGGPQRVLKRIFPLTPLYFIFFPLAHHAAKSGASRPVIWALMGVMITIKALAGVIIVSCTLCINNLAPNRASLGALNGAAQSLASLTRAIGPPASTSLYAFGISHQVLDGQLVWIAFIALGILGAALSLRIEGANSAGWRKVPVKDEGEEDDDDDEDDKDGQGSEREADGTSSTHRGGTATGPSSRRTSTAAAGSGSGRKTPTFVFSTLRYDPLYEGNWHQLLPSHLRKRLEQMKIPEPVSDVVVVGGSTSIASRIPLASQHFLRLRRAAEAMHRAAPSEWPAPAELRTPQGLPSLSDDALEAALAAGLARLGSPDDPARVKLSLTSTGLVDALFGNLSPTPRSRPVVRIDSVPNDSDELRIRFKTSDRGVYEDAARRNGAHYGAGSSLEGDESCFDVLLWTTAGGAGNHKGAAARNGSVSSNASQHQLLSPDSSTSSVSTLGASSGGAGAGEAQGLITESTIANVIFELPSASSSSHAASASEKGSTTTMTTTRLITPRSSLPLLPGLMRAELLRTGLVQEADMSLSELRRLLKEAAAVEEEGGSKGGSEGRGTIRVWLCNALRGMWEIRVQEVTKRRSDVAKGKEADLLKGRV